MAKDLKTGRLEGMDKIWSGGWQVLGERLDDAGPQK